MSNAQHSNSPPESQQILTFCYVSANPETGYQGNCGNTIVAIAYLLTYLVISFLIVINMYIAVILENYSQATEDVTVYLQQICKQP